MAQATTSKRSSTLSTRKEIQGTPATKELWTVEVRTDTDDWCSYDAGLKAGPQFWVRQEPDRELCRVLLGEDPERGVRVIRWYRLVTTERI